MRFGKHREDDEDRPDEPVGIEVLHANPYLPSTPAGKADAHAADKDDAAQDGTTQLDPAEQEAYAQLKRMRAERRKKRLIKRGIVTGVIVALVAGIAIWRNVSAQQTAPTVQVVTQPVTRGPFTSEVTGSGSIKPISSTLVSPQIDGTIETVNVVAGQQVAAGDVLFTIKNDDLDRAVAEAERNVRSAQSALGQAKKGVDEANQQVKDAKKAKTAADKAAKQAASTGAALGTVPTADPQAAKEAVSAAQQAASSANDQVEAAKIQLETANDALAKAQEQADQRTVRAPVAGSVIELNAQPGASLGQAAANAAQGGSGSGALCQIADLSQMTVTVQVGEVDINKVTVDQKGTATFSAVTDASLEATVRSIATTSSSDPSGGYGYGGGGSGVTYAVDLVIPAPDPRLKPGMTANVSIVTQSIDSALVVPTTAVSDMGDGTGMLVVEDDPETHNAHTVLVKILATNGSETAVEATGGSMLAEGENVIVSGSEAANIEGDGGVGAPGAAGGSASSSGSADGTASSDGTYTEYDENGNVVGAGGSAKVG